MPAKYQRPIIVDEFIVSPHRRLIRILGITLSAFLILVAATLLGYRGRRHHVAPIPRTLSESEFGIPIVVTILIISVALLVALWWLNDEYPERRIFIEDGNLTSIWKGQHEEVNLVECTGVSFLIVPFGHVLFGNKFHRLGRLKVSWDKGTRIFYFPIRNDGLATYIRQFARP